MLNLHKIQGQFHLTQRKYASMCKRSSLYQARLAQAEGPCVLCCFGKEAEPREGTLVICNLNFGCLAFSFLIKRKSDCFAE